MSSRISENTSPEAGLTPHDAQPFIMPPADSHSCGAPASESDRPQSEIRSDFGQVRSDFDPQAATQDPQSAWAQQPDEPADDYQLFAAWLKLPAPRRFPEAVSTLGCSLQRLRRLSARYRWRKRAADFDRHRARAIAAELDRLLLAEAMDWRQRVERFREAEWALHEQMLATAHQVLQLLQKHPGRTSITELVAVLELADTLGRRACGMPLNPPHAAAPAFQPPSGYLSAEEALHKIYGEKT